MQPTAIRKMYLRVRKKSEKVSNLFFDYLMYVFFRGWWWLFSGEFRGYSCTWDHPNSDCIRDFLHCFAYSTSTTFSLLIYDRLMKSIEKKGMTLKVDVKTKINNRRFFSSISLSSKWKKKTRSICIDDRKIVTSLP